MLKNYLNKRPVYVFNHDGTNPNREPLDLTFLTIKFVVVGVTAILVMSLVIFYIMVLA